MSYSLLVVAIPNKRKRVQKIRKGEGARRKSKEWDVGMYLSKAGVFLLQLHCRVLLALEQILHGFEGPLIEKLDVSTIITLKVPPTRAQPSTRTFSSSSAAVSKRLTRNTASTLVFKSCRWLSNCYHEVENARHKERSISNSAPGCVAGWN